MDDGLMRIFGSDRISSLMQKLGMEEGEAIEHPWVTRAIENAQRKVEGRNFDIRKQLLEYDDVANEQRKLVYGERRELMAATDVSDNVAEMREEVVEQAVNMSIPPQSLPEQWNLEQLEQDFKRDFGVDTPVRQWLANDINLHEEKLRDKLLEHIDAAYALKCKNFGDELMRHLEKSVTLQVLDAQWKEHLSAMDYLRQGIGLRGYAQKNPKQEYKREAFEMFTAMLERVKREVVIFLSRVKLREEDDLERTERERRQVQQRNMQMVHPKSGEAQEPLAAPMGSANVPSSALSGAPVMRPLVRDQPKVGRNSPCPCGSGKKYKQCHGKLA
jgi:preprotein translocase subunit SecA